ncbi:MAG TPA: hypothetical protein VNN62_05620 [Methylomirabilota bacterium]|jgi:hypothetical protein|nr:hypothetical protein [Methylomirabilota bacterium]
MKRLLTVVGIGIALTGVWPAKGTAVMLQNRAVIIPASPSETLQKEAVFAFLQEYFSALATGEVEKLAVYHPTLSPQQLATLRDYFAYTIRDLRIRLDHVQVNVGSGAATITFARTDQFIDRPTGRPVEKSIQLSTMLVQGANGWRLAGTDQTAFALAGKHTSLHS